MLKVWWRQPMLALTKHALLQPGIRARAGAVAVFDVLCGLYDQGRADPQAQLAHGFVNPRVAGVPAFMIDGDMVLVRNAEGRMKAVHSYSMRAYVELARKALGSARTS
jgi:hypothetical protein